MNIRRKVKVSLESSSFSILTLLGAGFIVKGTGDQISGLKRAGLLWTCAAVGMGFAYQYYIITIYLIFVLQVFSKSDCLKN